MKKIFWVFLAVVVVAGCRSIQPIVQKDVVILPEERIFTVQAGTKVHVWLDKQDLGEISFPTDMKLVSDVVLIRQEQKLNDAVLDKVKTEKEKDKWIAILGTALAAFGGVVGIWNKIKSAQTKKPS